YRRDERQSKSRRNKDKYLSIEKRTNYNPWYWHKLSLPDSSESDRKYKKSPKTTEQRKNNKEKAVEKDVEILDMFKEFVKTKMKKPESEDIPPLRLPEIT
ncbi:16527_t:CDS:2, partial [Funneliformis caledonium]